MGLGYLTQYRFFFLESYIYLQISRDDQQKMNPTSSLQVSYLTICQGFFFLLNLFFIIFKFYLYYSPQVLCKCIMSFCFLFLWVPECLKDWDSVPIADFVTLLELLAFCFLVLCSSNMFVAVLFYWYLSDACLFSNESQKMHSSGWEGRQGGTGKSSVGRAYMKIKSVFNKRKKRKL